MRWLPIACVVQAAACAYNPLFPDLRGAADHAREVAPRCEHVSEDANSPGLAAGIEAVDPAYSYVQSGNDRAVRLRGARLHLRPQPNVTAELLQRGLECHEARVTMGSAPLGEDDPYALPGAWLDITANSTGDGFVVAILADDFTRAQEVLTRARRFAASRP